MRAILFSMPDDMPFFSSAEFKVPSLAGGLLAANAPRHDVAVADLTLKRGDVAGAVTEALRTWGPGVVGLSAMSFQFDTAQHVARLVRREMPEVKIVLGGYHATLMHEEIANGPDGELFDFLIRGEGDHAFRELLDVVRSGGDLERVKGLSFRTDRQTWQHNPGRELEDLNTIRPPDRSRRLWSGYRYILRPVEVIETSRGCTMPCTFCSMQQMYGRTFRPYDLEQVIKDIADASSRGCQAVLFSDDNITLDVPRLIELCKRIVHARLNHILYVVQGSSRGMASSEELALWLDRANFRAVFLGMENVSRRALRYMGKGDIVDQTRRAIELLHRHRILVIGGIILGMPWDGKEELEENFDFLRRMQVDFFGDQIITPYPKTAARQEQLDSGLVVNPSDFRWYNGFWANVRTEKLSADELLFYRCLYHRMYTEWWMPQTLRQTFPEMWLFKNFFWWPVKTMRRSWVRRNKSLREFYKLEMTRCIMQNNFFGDRKPYVPFDKMFAASSAGISRVGSSVSRTVAGG